MTSTAVSPEEDGRSNDGPSASNVSPGTGDNQNLPKPKRLACLICRKRKLRCDGARPSCSTCSRLGHSCAYDEVRKKSGPKRGYVKALEERLKQVESLLQSQEPSASGNNPSSSSAASARPPSTSAFTVPSLSADHDIDQWQTNAPAESPQAANLDDFNFNASILPDIGNGAQNFTFEIMQLGLQEPLPPQDVIDELHQIYFQKIAPTSPIIHRFRYLAAMSLAPTQRPPVCLRYAMWTMAASITDKYLHHRDVFYERARRYLEADYIKGHGEHMISVAHAQTHIILATYELKMMYFPRAWMSTGSAVRLCQMMGLHRLDGAGLDVKQCVPPPRDWTEKEERRRTFWMAFCEDRYASIGTGWPMIIDENDIFTNLPASEEAFELSRQEASQSLKDAMSPSGAGKLTSFGSNVLMACLFGKNLIHLHRPDPEDRNDDLNGEFWKRHRLLDNILLNTSLCLPPGLKLPAGLQNPNVVFTNMCIHTSTICLHQAAIFTADKHRLPASVSGESKIRCITAANEIASIMRMVSHMDLTTMNPFVSFCLYVAARVFVQYLKSLPDDSKTIDSLRFLLSAMNALKRRNPLTESFLVQLDVDLEALGSRIPKLKALFPRSGDGSDPRSVCEELQTRRDHGGGILGYRNECYFMKTTGDDGNPASNLDIAELSDSNRQQEPNTAGAGPSSASSGGNNYHTGAGWAAGGQHNLTQRERGNESRASGGGETLQQQLAGIMMHPSSGHSGLFEGSNANVSGTLSDSNDISVSPDTGPSSGPTPNSSSASENILNNGGNNLAPPVAATNASGSSSFAASPVPSNQPPGGLGVGDGTNMFVPSGMGVRPSGMTPTQHFSMPSTAGGSSTGGNNNAGFGPQSSFWNIPGPQQSGSADGMLRSLLNMGSLEMMDMNWEPASQ